MHSLTKGLMRAVKTNGTLLTPPMRSWVSSEQCYARDLSCFFEGLAPTCDAYRHPEGGAGVNEVTQLPFGTSNDETGAVYLKFPDWVDEREEHRAIGVGTPSFYEGLVPKEFQHLGWLGWSSHLVSFLFRPNRLMRTELLRRLRLSGLGNALQIYSGVEARYKASSSPPVIGMHVRRGDACEDSIRTGRLCSPLSSYMVHARKVRQATGATIIFIATDSEGVLNETRPYIDEGFTFLRMSEPLDALHKLQTVNQGQVRTREGKPSTIWDDVLRHNLEEGRVDDNRQVAWEATLDAYLLSFCDVLIGKHTSNLFRVAYELKAARCDCAPPFVSLDAPWCFDWGVFAGRSPIGNFPC